MEPMENTIRSYKKGIYKLKHRIQTLNREINENGGQEKSDNSSLVRRRYLLYSQVNQMQSSIKEMQDYLKLTAPPRIIIKNISFISLKQS